MNGYMTLLLSAYIDGHIQVIHWSAKDFNSLLKSFSYGESSFTPYLTNESHLSCNEIFLLQPFLCS